MPVTIREITSEVVLARDAEGAGGGGAGERPAAGEDELVDRVVRRALERVLERLRLEWER
ncbi:MAG TPA: hypothetical protein VIU86_03315 [Gaiellaceae bacterium]